MNKYIVHINRTESFGMKADSIYTVEQFIKQDLNINHYCITLV